jgi:oxygen-independent coproporphyrinogen-3 oxidase
MPNFSFMQINSDLIAKYNLPVPRYTSYPTVPFWKDKINVPDWEEAFRKQFQINNSKEGISLYIHLPFCESLCSYCGCNKRITTNHKVEDEYLDAIRKEWTLYRAQMQGPPVIRELHLGGGTPTFFSPANLRKLLGFILADAIVHPEREFSIEGHPNNTTIEHIRTLYDLGFRRISYGVQDNDPIVQQIICRIQPIENVQKATENARKVGFKSVNFDLIYGLPFQTVASMEKTMKQVLEMKPDRIAFYSYAHVPWTSRGQRLFDENDLPSADQKLELYLTGKRILTESGYTDIGMDHFALPDDDLYIAWREGRMHRNFMGYTTQKTAMLIGLGVSSISDIGTAFAQNEKTLQEYYELVNQGILPIQKGYFMTGEDISFREYILDISCRNETQFKKEDLPILEKITFPELSKLESDELIIRDAGKLVLTETGKHFLRNICRAFDLHLLRDQSLDEKKTFSKAI